MNHAIGDRASCSECGHILMYTSDGWKHSGINQPRHMALPAAMPLGAVWVGDAPEDDWPDSGSITIGKEIKQSDMPPLPTNVTDLYRVLSQQLTPVQQTMLQAFWLLMAEDSRMLDYLDSQVIRSSDLRNGLIFVWDKRDDRSLRAIIKERMNPKAPDEFERNPEMPFSLKDAGKA